VFVTTKVWTTHFAPNDLERSTKESLTRLRLSEVDLLLLHWPNPQVPLTETLGALARVKKLGMVRHIGVSNFTVALIEEAVAACPEPLNMRPGRIPPLSGPDQGEGGVRATRHGSGRL
jgi:2,5-diketo-D-gluconate reductase B